MDDTDAKTGARGRFLVIDGVDGCGKSTQALRLVARLGRAGSEPLHVREPGSTALGEAVREQLLAGEDLSPAVEALLVAAARRHLLETVVAPALARGRDVVCERSHSSTFAYQGIAGGLGGEHVLQMLRDWASGPEPDLVVILGLPSALAAERRGGPSDRIEARNAAFHVAVARGYAEYARITPSAVLVDGGAGPDEVEEAVWQEVAGARAD